MCIHRNQLSSTLQNKVNSVMERRQEGSSNTIFNETKVDLRIKENLHKYSRLAETEGPCHDSCREDSDTENVLKLLFCKKKKEKRKKDVNVLLSHCDSSP